MKLEVLKKIRKVKSVQHLLVSDRLSGNDKNCPSCFAIALETACMQQIQKHQINRRQPSGIDLSSRRTES